MSERRKIVLVVLVIGIIAALSVVGVAAAQNGDQMPPRSERRSAIIAGENAAKQLLLLMDTDKNGKVSRQEWMSFMEAEFDRLDKNKDGMLDIKELEQSQMRPIPSSRVGK
jgi:hypothetical protein